MRVLRPVVLAAALTVMAATPVVAAPAASAQTMRDRQWYLTTLDVAAAQKISQGEGVVVAVVDSGIGKHPDIDGQALAGISYLSDDNSLADDSGHGSGMAGLIVAKGGDADHLLGIAPKAKVLSVRTMPGTAPALGTWTHIPEAIRWAVDHGAKVINISKGGQVESGGESAVQYALDHDVLVVASTGNTREFLGTTAVLEPATFRGVLAVTAVDRDGKAWDGAVHGPETALAAPGVDIPTVSNARGRRVVGYDESTNSTSNAAAIVSGAAALIRAKYPQLPVKDVVQRLIATADDAGAPGRDPEYGYGRLNLVKALTADVAPVATNPLLSGVPGAPDDEGDSDTFAGALGDAMMQMLTTGAVCVGVLLLAVLIMLLTRRRRT
ncbi:type VII secretion-associated serine protease mycosin [Dactylosporangium maewongense]|uniref:Type VII secretion-associated serine protease mycosin n=1 Tax=Dactylosporangium maewongense TaxID=634393 RepID=A0ABN2CRW2_9ACTN